jgi:DNA-binding response OmpR family regulator
MKRVLVIEDEAATALELSAALSDAGFQVVGPAQTLAEAVSSAEEGGFDAAVLDANLNGSNSGVVADLLIKRGIPFVVVSGYSREFLPLAIAHAPLIAKPFDAALLVATVQRLCSQGV